MSDYNKGEIDTGSIYHPRSTITVLVFVTANIGTSILLSRVTQAWVEIHQINGTPISDRTFWIAVYSMAWASRKHIRVPSLQFDRVNVPIIMIAMIVGCIVLIGEVYITRHGRPMDFSKL